MLDAPPMQSGSVELLHWTQLEAPAKFTGLLHPETVHCLQFALLLEQVVCSELVSALLQPMRVGLPVD